VLPGDGRLAATLDARAAGAVAVVDLAATERAAPGVHLVRFQLGAQSFDQNVHPVDHQRRLQLHVYNVAPKHERKNIPNYHSIVLACISKFGIATIASKYNIAVNVISKL